MKLKCCRRNVLEVVIEFLGGQHSVFEVRMLSSKVLEVVIEFLGVRRSVFEVIMLSAQCS